MKQINCYLTFDGDCREAMTFYARCLEGSLNMKSFGDIPHCPEGSEKRVMHAHLAKGEGVLMASDSMPGQPPVKGDNFSISIATETVEETDRIFTALSEGGTVTMPLQDMFWGAYFGMVKDRFGIHWMLNCERTKA